MFHLQRFVRLPILHQAQGRKANRLVLEYLHRVQPPGVCFQVLTIPSAWQAIVRCLFGEGLLMVHQVHTLRLLSGYQFV